MNKTSVQEKLRQAYIITEAACDFAGMWVFTYDMDKGEAYPGNKLQKEFGFPEVIKDFPEEIFDYDYVLTEYITVYRDAIQKVKDGARQVEFEIQSRYPDGVVHWMKFRVNRLEEQGMETGIAIITAQPIDIEKELEAQAYMERKKLLANDQSLLGYVVTNLTRNSIIDHRTFHNDREKMQYGQRMDDEVEKAALTIINPRERRDFLHMHDRRSILEDFEDGIASRSMEFQRKRPSGRIMWVRNVWNILRDPETGDLHLYEYSYNIHDQKMLEEVLNAAVNYNFERFGSINMINGQITMLYNRRERQKMTVEVRDYEEVSSAYGRKVVLPEDTEEFLYKISLAEVRKNLTRNDAYEFTHRVLEGDGKIHYKRTLFRVYDRETQSVLMSRSDVTQMVETEEEKREELALALQQAEQATRAKTDFLSRMSHDLRTPMNAIIGLTALTLDEAKNPAQVRENMTKMRAASDFMLSLVNDILDMAKIEDGAVNLQLESCSYHEFLVNMHTMFAAQCEQREIHLNMQKPKMNPVILCDKTRLNQIFFNLFSNAMKYTPPGGTISYYIENLEIEEDRLTCDYVIEDTGIGMEKEFQKRMFDPFVQEDDSVTPELQGSGLGLSITKSLVELMGGYIHIDSIKGRGTKVTVHLSFQLMERDAVVERSHKPDEGGDYTCLTGKNILLVEDHPLNAQIARKVLEKQGMSVAYAENGKVAVDVFATSKEQAFDAILMDIRMPEMSGLDATRAIRDMARGDAKTIPIIAMSANAYDEDRDKSLYAGMNEHLAKPINPKILYETLTKYISPV